MILSKPQAEAAYYAMRALDDVTFASGINVSFPTTVGGDLVKVSIEETDDSVLRVSYTDRYGQYHTEHYEDQTGFCTAYSVEQS